MMVKNVIRLAGEFSLRSQVNLSDVSQIHTTSRDTTRQWNNLIYRKALKTGTNDIVVHICPWEDEDWQQYLEPNNYISRMVIWLADDMEVAASVNEKIQIVRYQSAEISERFAIVAGTGMARALVSWSQPSKSESFLGVLISSPTVSTAIVRSLEQRLASNQT